MRKLLFTCIFLLSIFFTLSSIAQPLSGTYTIGGDSPNYLNINAAINDLKIHGINNAVVFNIRTGTYNEVIEIPYIEGSSESNTITFQAESGIAEDVVLYKHFIKSGYVLRMDSCSNITIKNVKFSCNNSNSNDDIKIISFVDTCKNIIIKNNILEFKYVGYYTYGIYVTDFLKNSEISNNILKKCKNTIRVSAGENIDLSNNFLNQCESTSFYNVENLNIFSNKSSYGMDLFLFKCSGNTLISKNDASSISIYNSILDSVLIINNMTLELEINNSSNVGLYYNTIKNNTTITGPDELKMKNNIFNSGITINDADANYESDYNIFNTQITWNYENYSLSEYQDITHNDLNSYYLTPIFVSNTDLHIYSGAHMHNLGTHIYNIDDDFDGESRSLDNPDIGADEFILASYDLSVYEIINPIENPCEGEDSIKIRFINYGESLITSCIINCQINSSAVISKTWSGSLNTADTSAVIWVCNNTFTIDSSYKIKIWASELNTNPDQNNENDTLIVDLYTRIPGGEYIISGSKADYESLTEAIEDLKLRGICGSVHFNISSGYSSSDTYVIPKILGNTDKDTIVIQTASGNQDVGFSLSTTVKNEIFKLNGVRHLTLKNLYFNRFYVNGNGNQIITSNINYGGTLNLINNSFSSECDFFIDEEDGVLVSLGYGMKATLINNAFNQGTVALISKCDSLFVINNQFRDQAHLGVKIYYADTVQFAYNTFAIQNISNFQGYSTIFQSSHNIDFHHNYVGSAKFESCTGINTWSRIYNNLFYDNFFSLRFSDDDYDEEAVLLLLSSDFIEFYHNTIISEANDEDSRHVPTVYLWGAYNVNYNIRWRNNNIINYNIESETNTSCLISIGTANLSYDNNNFYSLYTNDSAYAIKNNISFNPNFIDNKFHHNTPELNNCGTPINYIMDDLDGTTRNLLNPDIGAYEYEPELFIGNDTVLCTEESIILDAGTGYDTYLWSNGATNQSITVDSTGIGIGEKAIRVDVTKSSVPYYDIIKIEFESCNSCESTYSTSNIISCFSYTSPSGKIWHTSGTYIDTIPNFVGCDSILTINLTIGNEYEISEIITINSGSDYTFPDGTVVENITLQVVHTSYLQTELGCDSIIETTVSVNCSQAYNSTETILVCEGSDYTFPDGTEETNITSQIMHTSYLQTYFGCDSTIVTTVNIVENNGSETYENITVCSGDSYTFPDGTVQNNITVGTVHVSNLETISGCDSIVETTLIVYPAAVPSFSYECDSVKVFFQNTTENGKYYFWEFGDGTYSFSENPIHVYPELSEYNVRLKAANDCGSRSIYQIINVVYVPTGNEKIDSQKILVYPNPTNERIHIAYDKPINVELYSLSGVKIIETKNTDIDVSGIQDGTYIILIKNEKGELIQKVKIIKE